VDFGKINAYNRDKGFGFVGRTFYSGNRDVFFHITTMQRQCKEIADVLNDGESFQDINFWYTSQQTEKGEQVFRVWRAIEEIPEKYESELDELVQVIEAYWKDLDALLPDWLDEMTVQIVGSERKSQLASERDELKEVQSREIELERQRQVNFELELERILPNEIDKAIEFEREAFRKQLVDLQEEHKKALESERESFQKTLQTSQQRVEKNLLDIVRRAELAICLQKVMAFQEANKIIKSEKNIRQDARSAADILEERLILYLDKKDIPIGEWIMPEWIEWVTKHFRGGKLREREEKKVERVSQIQSIEKQKIANNVKETMRNSEFLRQKGRELYHMTHINNLEMILARGLLSKNTILSGKIAIEDISDSDVQGLRSERLIGGTPLHNFVPLYIEIRNPMLYVRKSIQEDLVIIAVSPDILDIRQEALYTDGNAASRGTKFYRGDNSLQNLNWKILEDDYWTNYEDGKRIKCSEVLIPDRIETQFFSSLIVKTPTNLVKLEKMTEELGLQVKVNSHFFFS
jgi:cold shock CspA family protein